jgi:hypothetical protein
LVIRNFTWNQNLGHSTVMMAKNDGYCVLTGVGGKFEGQGEGVWIDQSNGFWLLTGSSGQTDVNGRATCVSWADYNNSSGATFQWNMWETAFTYPCSFLEPCRGSVPGQLNLKNSNSWCTLGGVSGVFHGGGEWAQVELVGGTWQALGHNGVQGNSTSGDGQCLQFPNRAVSFSHEFQWTQGSAPVDLGSASDRICALTLVRGHFAGGGEHVEITQIGGDWVLTGGSQQSGVEAWARCSRFHQ